jgi:hypothetical protein
MDPDPDPAPDPSFSHKGVEWTEIMLQKKISTENFDKNLIFKTIDNVPAGKF